MWAALGLALAVPAHAQDNRAVPSPPAQQQTAPTTNEVGPRELRDFSLPGTVTRPAQQPAPVVVPPRPAPAAPRATEPAPARAQPPTASPRERAAPPPETETRRAAPRVEPEPSSPSVAAPAPDSPAPAAVEPSAAPPPALTPPAQSPGWSAWWLVALAAVAAGGFFAWKRRMAPAAPGYARAAAAPAALPPAPVPATRSPAPVPAAPTPPPVDDFVSIPARRPAPRPAGRAVPADGAVVSTALSPRLVFELRPLRAEVDPAGNAILSYELILTNVGSAPARDVLIEAKMVNAGPTQDADIAAFFQNPVGTGDRLPIIEPKQKIVLRARTAAASGDYRALEIDGRRLLVPLLAFNALYRSGGLEKQDSASFLVGRGGADGGKMAPLPLDGSRHAFAALSARSHSEGLAKIPA